MTCKTPDLTALDFCLWSYVKDPVYEGKTTTPDPKKTQIIRGCSEIAANVVRRGTADVVNRS